MVEKPYWNGSAKSSSKVWEFENEFYKSFMFYLLCFLDFGCILNKSTSDCNKIQMLLIFINSEKDIDITIIQT